jgi:hypothetical protein
MRVLTVPLLLALLLTGCSTHAWRMAQARETGRAQATLDVAAGNLELRTWGIPIPGDSFTFEKLLTERLGVRVGAVGGCLVTSEQAAHTEGYNAVVEAEIKRRFGSNIFDTLKEEAARIDKEAASPAGATAGAAPPQGL